ncbi:transposase [Tateyamaria pelophila]|uniref:transposase n=1 Tax=Tateyamaria pelophila TaxID=328415 RepID=UPI001CBBFFE7|nr:transposase [Tateyamaria pelophila]
MLQSISPKPVLSPVNGKPILFNFDGAEMSSNAGLTLLREVERQHGLAGLVASCLTDQRDPNKTRHSLDDIARFRILMIAAGYEDGNDAADLRHDPSFKLALEREAKSRYSVIASVEFAADCTNGRFSFCGAIDGFAQLSCCICEHRAGPCRHWAHCRPSLRLHTKSTPSRKTSGGSADFAVVQVTRYDWPHPAQCRQLPAF